MDDQENNTDNQEHNVSTTGEPEVNFRDNSETNSKPATNNLTPEVTTLDSSSSDEEDHSSSPEEEDSSSESPVEVDVNATVDETTSTNSTQQNKEEPPAVPVLTREEKRQERFVKRAGVLQKGVSFDCTSFEVERDPMDSLLEASLTLLLSSMEISSVTNSALDELTHLATRFMSKLFTALHKLTEYQRRGRPAKVDLQLLTRLGMVDLEGIAEAAQKTKIYHKNSTSLDSDIRKIDDKAKRLCEILDAPAEDDMVTEDDPAFVFFNDTSAIIHQVVPPSPTDKPYIPSWMPPLPPKHTYQATPKYSKPLDDPVKVKEKLVVEARLGEKALHHILDLKDNVVPVERGDSDPEIRSDELASVSEEEEKEEEDEHVETATSEHGGLVNGHENEQKSGDVSGKTVAKPEPKKPSMNIVEFAKKRMAILEKRKQEKERLYHERINSEEALLGKDLGFYTKNEKLPPNYNQFLSGFYSSKYDEVITGLKIQQKRRAKLIEKRRLKQQKMQEEASKAKSHELEFNDYEEDDLDMDDIEFEDDVGEAKGSDIGETSNLAPVVSIEESVST